MKIFCFINLCFFLSCATANAIFVTVTEIDGDTFITGDDLPDSIVVEGIFDGMLRISGRSAGPFNSLPTLINGGTEPVVVDVHDDVIIQLGEGSNKLVLRNVYLHQTSSSVIVHGGNGNDNVEIENVTLREDLNIQLKSGNGDFCQVFDVIADRIIVNQTNGGATVNMGFLNSSRFIMDLGRDNDYLLIGEVNTSRLEITMGVGHDLLILGYITTYDRRSFIDGDKGYDRFTGPPPPTFRGNILGFEKDDVSNIWH